MPKGTSAALACRAKDGRNRTFTNCNWLSTWRNFWYHFHRHKKLADPDHTRLESATHLLERGIVLASQNDPTLDETSKCPFPNVSRLLRNEGITRYGTHAGSMTFIFFEYRDFGGAPSVF